MDDNIKNAIAHFDKKVTDYQIYVDRELQNQDKQIKSHKNYLLNTLNSHNKETDNSVIAFGIPYTANGKTISLDDVLGIKHKCSCKLTSDTYVDVVGGSRNIFNTTNENTHVYNEGSDEPHSKLETIINEDGSILISGSTEDAPADLCFKVEGLIPNYRYTFSLRSSNLNAFDPSTPSSGLHGFDKEGEFIYGEGIDFEGDRVTFTWKENYGHIKINWFFWGVDDSGLSGFTLYPQLEVGDTMTDWVPNSGGTIEAKTYVEDFSDVKLTVSNGTTEKEYTSNVNGVIENIESYSPNMEITTDNEHVNIEFNYYIDTKTYIDKKIAEMVGEGND